MKLRGRHIPGTLQQAMLFSDQGHSPLGLPAATLKRPASRLEKEWRQLRSKIKETWHHLRPREHVRHDLQAFSLAVARWLRALIDLQAHDTQSVQAAENALIALVMLYADGPLAHGADLQQLYACHVDHQWKRLDHAASEAARQHASWLLHGSEDGLVRSLLPRIEHRRLGFGWYEDYFRHMSASDYASHLRGCQILADRGPALIQRLLQHR